jgi:hypothetical protein
VVNLKTSPDFSALVGSGALFLILLLWVGWGERAVRGVSPGALEIGGPPPDFESVSMPESRGGSRTWSGLTVSDNPEVWAFDVFTPPEIYFDPATGRFSVSAPEAVERGPDILQTSFGISLVSVQRQPFRLQLVGYAGLADEPWGIFANEVTGEGIVAQGGHRFAGLDLDLQTLEIKREDLIVPESMPLREIVAVAQVRDNQAGRVWRLTSGYPTWTDRPRATISIDTTGERREVEAGQQIELAEAVVEITGVFANPNSVTAVKLLPDGTRESIRLEQDNPSEVQFGSDTIFESP